MADLKKAPFEKINPNGRVPAIEDPNTGITLWESGAIIEYLQEIYDKNNTLNYKSFPERYHVKQWSVSLFLGEICPASDVSPVFNFLGMS
jgi:glutathione S-transferase